MRKLTYFARVSRWWRASLVLLVLAVHTPAAHANDDSLIVAIEPWAPFASPDLPRNGFLSALTQAALEAAGLDSRIEFMPWARALLEVRQGDRQVLMGAYYTEERAKVYWYSEPVYETRVGLIGLDTLDIATFESLRDLTGYTIGVGRGFANSKAFDAAEFLEKEIVKDQVLNLRKLYSGRVDMITGSFDRIPFTAIEQDRDTERLVYLEPPLKTHTIHVGISRALDNGEEIRDAFDRGLAEIRANGTYERILREIGPAN